MSGMTWMQDAACLGMDPARYFPGRGEVVDSEAKDACNRCSVRPDCLDYALEEESVGWWGGMSAAARDRERVRRGLPRYTRAGVVVEDVPAEPPRPLRPSEMRRKEARRRAALGADTFDNLQAMCQPCNSRKGARV